MNSQNVLANDEMNTNEANTINQSQMIKVVDCTEFAQCRKDMYKSIPIESVFSFDTVEMNFSRYEILNNDVRKLYFDIDGVPLMNENLVHEFMHTYEEFFKTKINDASNTFTEPFKYVITSNKNSSTHPGLSHHVIVWNYSMDYLEQKHILNMFKNSTAGTKYIKYVDSSVYSSLRLFKVPNFIGIPINANPENYHRPDASDRNISHYLIQYTTDTQRLRIIPGVKREEYHQNLLTKNNTASNTNWEFCIQLYNLIKSLGAEQFDEELSKRKSFRIHSRNERKSIKEKWIANAVNFIIESEFISKNDKKKIVRIAKTGNDKLIIALVYQICRKYNLTFDYSKSDYNLKLETVLNEYEESNIANRTKKQIDT